MSVRAIGCDPGFANTGLAVVELRDGQIRCLAVKYVHTPASRFKRSHAVRTDADDLRRLKALFDAVAHAIDASKATVMGIEPYKIAGDRGAPGRLARRAGGNAWKTTKSEGICVAAAFARGLQVYAHLPVELKLGICGYAQASKLAVERAILQSVPGAAKAVLRADLAPKNREHVFDAIGHAVLALKTVSEVARMTGTSID